LEAIACHGVRQPDSDTFRYWESAGTCHVSQQVQQTRQRLQERDGILGRPPEGGINRIPMALLYDAVFHHMHRWLADGIAPPVLPKIEFSGEPAEVVRDAHGIAIGGIRLPQVEVPLATNSAIPRSEGIFALLGGSCEPFAAEKVAALYGDSSRSRPPTFCECSMRHSWMWRSESVPTDPFGAAAPPAGASPPSAQALPPPKAALRRSRPSARSAAHAIAAYFAAIFAQASLSDTVRLKTGVPGRVSGSTAK
jgi:hypothetical protein